MKIELRQLRPEDKTEVSEQMRRCDFWPWWRLSEVGVGSA